MQPEEKRRTTRASSAQLLPSHGGPICNWIESYLVHSEGDYYERPFRLTREQKRLIWKINEYVPGSESGDYPYGRRVARRIMYGRPKGWGKTELFAALAVTELAGPYAPIAPDIPVAAASFEQADKLFGAARTMIEQGPLAPFFDCFDTEILRKDGKPGRLYRVAAVAGTNDGGGHTARFADETHEWLGSKERTHLVLTNGLAKRRNSFGYDSTTAGADDWTNPSTLAGRLYAKGRAIREGELTDPTFLFDWIEHPDPECELDTEEKVWEAARTAYKGAGEHVDLEQIVGRFYEIAEYEWRRYYLNQFTLTADVWLPTGTWSSCANPDRRVPRGEGTRIALGFDGSYNGDSTALVGCTLPGEGGVPHVFLIACWERPKGKRGETWVVPREEVKAVVAQTFRDFQVVAMACDPPGWHTEIEEWARAYGQMVVQAFDTNRPSLMAPSCSKFYTAVRNRQLSHDGNPTLNRHLRNARVREVGADGAVITKEERSSPKKIDAAIAAVLAHDRATEAPPAEPFVLSTSW